MIADEGAAIRQPRALSLPIAVWRDGAADIHPSVCRFLIDIHLGLAHGIAHSLDALVASRRTTHVLDFAGALLDHWLLMPFRDLELALLHATGTAGDLTGCGGAGA